MSDQSMKKIFSQLPDDFIENSVRDVKLLTAAVFGQVHFTTLPKYFGVQFTAILMHNQQGQMGIYRSPSEYEKFSKTVADKIVEKPDRAKECADKSITITDDIYRFIKENQSPQSLVTNREEFLDMFRDFFAYHQAVYFGGEYLLNHQVKDGKPKSLDQAIQILDKAYTYNEMVAPDLERYFAKLGVENGLPSELSRAVHKEPATGSSVLYLRGEEIVLTPKEADELTQMIDEKQSKNGQTKREVTGLGVGGGVYTGKVRVIKQLDQLDKIEPGEVLVTPITRPQFNEQIKEAGAIVADLGGLLSHPSILAREQGIPCIVGAEIATKVFITGDTVEVDADQGVVRKIK